MLVNLPHQPEHRNDLLKHHSTSILDLYKVFEPLSYAANWHMGAPLHITPVQVGAKLGKAP